MKKHLRTLIVGVSALIALGTLSACSGGKTTEATNTSEAVTTPPAATAKPFPQSARYIADMKAADGKPMTIGISVDGASIAAYACNGTDDEAWFFGNQTDGKLDIKSRFRDTLKAEFNGTDVAGDLTMNGVAYKFTAAPVSGAAGMYTAEFEGVASVVGRSSRRQRDRRAVQPEHRSETRAVRPAATRRRPIPCPGAQYAPAAGRPQQIVEAAERLDELDHQQHAGDSESGERHLPPVVTTE